MYQNATPSSPQVRFLCLSLTITTGPGVYLGDIRSARVHLFFARCPPYYGDHQITWGVLTKRYYTATLDIYCAMMGCFSFHVMFIGMSPLDST